jgi:[ribosomal protein S18]-alanine N-acetyltransferase
MSHPPRLARPAAPTASAGPAATVRAAAATDLPALAEIEEAAFADPWSAGGLAAELDHPEALILVAVDGESGVCGYAAFRRLAEEAELLRVAVRPGRRRRGIAQLLVSAGLAHLEALETSACHLEVRAGNGAAAALYRSLGFAVVGRRRAYYNDGEDALLLSLPLPRPPRRAG